MKKPVLLFVLLIVSVLAVYASAKRPPPHSESDRKGCFASDVSGGA
jgi:hypothetical protein